MARSILTGPFYTHLFGQDNPLYDRLSRTVGEADQIHPAGGGPARIRTTVPHEDAPGAGHLAAEQIADSTATQVEDAHVQLSGPLQGIGQGQPGVEGIGPGPQGGGRPAGNFIGGR